MFFNKNNDYVSRVSSGAFKKLALNNVKKSMKNYLIYFITLTFGVTILYTFNSLDNDIAILGGNALLSQVLD